MSRLVEALQSGRVLLMDGAMGTELQRLGLREGEPSALWNLTQLEQVCAVHRAYVDAGADVLVTNTFQAYEIVFDRYWTYHRVDDGLAADFLNRGLRPILDQVWQAAVASVQLFHDRAPLTLADIGPIERASGSTLRRMLNIYRATDGLLFETWTAGAAYFRPFPDFLGVPQLWSFTYEKTASPKYLLAQAKQCAEVALRNGATALGANCGKEIDMDDMVRIVGAYRSKTEVPIFIRPNAGTPRRTASGWEYPRSPEYMADKLWPLLEAGVTMVGGCCGTTPAHIAAFRRVVDEWNARNAKK